MAARRLEEEGLHEGVPRGGLDPQGFQPPQGVQAPPQSDQLPIEGENFEVLVVPRNMNNRDIR